MHEAQTGSDNAERSRNTILGILLTGKDVICEKLDWDLGTLCLFRLFASKLVKGTGQECEMGVKCCEMGRKESKRTQGGSLSVILGRAKTFYY